MFDMNNQMTTHDVWIKIKELVGMCVSPFYVFSTMSGKHKKAYDNVHGSDVHCMYRYIHILRILYICQTLHVLKLIVTLHEVYPEYQAALTVSPYPWPLSLPLVVRVGVQYGGGHVHWLHPEECTPDENQKQICTCLHEYGGY